MMTWNSYMFHSPNSSLMEMLFYMHDYVMLFLFSVMMMVMLNMFYSTLCASFSIEFFENHQLENVWTLIPFILLSFIAIPSLKVLYSLDSCFFCGVSISVTGHQWYWNYCFKDSMNLEYDSYMLGSEVSSIRLLDVDNRLIIPTEIPMRFMVSSADVLHSWTLPSFGVKMDAIPGRINQFCFSSKRSGVFFGQCSEICGANHSFMPIVVESVPYKYFCNL